jgi:hypothetical protein
MLEEYVTELTDHRTKPVAELGADWRANGTSVFDVTERPNIVY